MSSSSGFHDLVGVSLEESEDGRTTVVLDATERHLNSHGTVHGGAIATLVDSAMGAAVATTGEAPVTIEMKVTYLEPAKPGRLAANAEVRRRGSRVTIVEAEVIDAEGSFVAHAIATFTTVGD
ncbi:MAG: hypothetical protein QOG64_3144 [Acidimicrobiaceae bacterium]|nr:hypothetical protein [Acidimicrobiaceae bacterium]